MVSFRLLGPVAVLAGDGPVEAGPPRQRAVLAALLADAGRPVTPEALVDRVWGAEPPAGARRSLHSHLARIRPVLARAGHGTLRLSSGAYVLEVDPDLVDIHRFRRLVAGGDLPALREALGLWQGEPLAGLAGPWAERTRESWGLQYLDSAVAWATAELAAGNPEPVITRLTELSAEHPLAEPVAAALIRALHAAGRPAEALVRFEAVRERLATELGTDPGPDLRAVHLAVLRGEAAVEQPRPAQLPADVAGFSGRAEQLGRLDAGVGVTLISGPPGVGKSALAVHWAHRAAARFPDGQLYLNLLGFDPAAAPVGPAVALRGFLDALGVPPERIPADLTGRAALYRSLLSGKRMLVVLDNARDAGQVRPLLPGGPSAVAVVTSRNQLTGLVAVDGAQPVVLGPLAAGEAYDLLVRRVDPGRVAAEPAAAEAIVEACARLPLALVIAAARARQTGFPLAALAAELAEARVRLDALDLGDPAGQVRAVFSWSYAALGEPAARLFRLLGLHPGTEISATAAAALAGPTTAGPATAEPTAARPTAAGPTAAGVRPLLAELTRGNLLTEHLPGRYAFHDLLREYARELVGEDRPAVLRVLDFYTHTAYAADRLLAARRDPMPVPLGSPTAEPAPPADEQEAMRWLAAEHHVLMAALSYAAGAGLHRHAWQLAWSLDTFLDRRGHWQDRVLAWQAALTGADDLGEPTAAALAHHTLAVAYTRLGQYEPAHTHLPRAIDLYQRAGDRAGEAHSHRQFAHLVAREGHPEQAIGHGRRALALFRAAGHERGQAIVLNSIGWYSAQTGDQHSAVEYCEEALVLLQRLGDRGPMAATWDSLGYANHQLGRYVRAAACYRHALDLHRELGDRFHEADVLTRLGETLVADGDGAAARTCWQQALDILTGLGHPDAAAVSGRLEALGVRPGPA